MSSSPRKRVKLTVRITAITRSQLVPLPSLPIRGPGNQASQHGGPLRQWHRCFDAGSHSDGYSLGTHASAFLLHYDLRHWTRWCHASALMIARCCDSIFNNLDDFENVFGSETAKCTNNITISQATFNLDNVFQNLPQHNPNGNLLSLFLWEMLASTASKLRICTILSVCTCCSRSAAGSPKPAFPLGGPRPEQRKICDGCTTRALQSTKMQRMGVHVQGSPIIIILLALFKLD